MHPTLMQEIARQRQGDLLREAEQARLGRAAIVWGDEPRRRVVARRRRLAALRPLLGRYY